MAQRVHDLMVEKTRELLKETFLQLIEEKGFGNITVRDLTLKAKINRGTFYLHYMDKVDLIDQMENALLNGLLQHMHSLSAQEMMECNQKSTPYDPLVQVFEYLKQNGRLLKGLLGANGDPAFSQKMKGYLKEGIFKDFIENIEDKAISKPYMTAFVTSAFLGIIEDWLNTDLQQSPAEMAVIYLKIKFFGMNA